MKSEHNIYKSDAAENEILGTYNEFVSHYDFVKGIDLETAQGTGQKLSSTDASFRWLLCRMAA